MLLHKILFSNKLNTQRDTFGLAFLHSVGLYKPFPQCLVIPAIFLVRKWLFIIGIGVILWKLVRFCLTAPQVNLQLEQLVSVVNQHGSDINIGFDGHTDSCLFNWHPFLFIFCYHFPLIDVLVFFTVVICNYSQPTIKNPFGFFLLLGNPILTQKSKLPSSFSSFSIFLQSISFTLVGGTGSLASPPLPPFGAPSVNPTTRQIPNVFRYIL